MIRDIDAGKIERAIIKDMSRFGRDYLQVGMYTEIIFPEKDIHFIAINDGVDSTFGTDDFTPFRNIINEWYAKDTSKKVRAVKKAKGMAGEHTNPHAPYGYMKNPENPKEWIVDEEAAEVVKEIFRLCVKGHGPLQIANILTERKILTPSAYAVKAGTKKVAAEAEKPYRWRSTIVCDILERPDYLGYTVNFKTYTKSYKNHKIIYNPPENWKIFENTQEAIIDKETFDTVQQIRQGRRRRTSLGEMPPLSGMLLCAECSRRMTLHRRSDKPNNTHFLCGAYKDDPTSCSSHYIRYPVVEQILLDNIRELTGFVSEYEDEFVKMVIDTDVQKKNKKIAKEKRQLKEKQSRIKELDILFQRLYEDNVSGKLTDERFNKLSDTYETEQKNLTDEVEEIQKLLDDSESQSRDVKNFLECVRKYTDIRELTPEILHAFIDKVIVHAADKSSGKRMQEIEIVYKHIGVLDNTKVMVSRGKVV